VRLAASFGKDCALFAQRIAGFGRANFAHYANPSQGEVRLAVSFGNDCATFAVRRGAPGGATFGNSGNPSQRPAGATRPADSAEGPAPVHGARGPQAAHGIGAKPADGAKVLTLVEGTACPVPGEVRTE
jgi:hypothetical protein